MQIRLLKKWCVLFLLLTFIPAAFALQNSNGSPDRIPDVLVSFGPANGAEYAIVVEKNTQTLFLFGYNGTFREVFRTKSSTGEAPGPKFRSGDRKTPEGVYFFTTEYEKRYLAPIYGTRAFPMDYPNILDRLEGRDGNAIWMHGSDKPIKPRDSNGCVALQNTDIDLLDKYITLHRTPIIIVDTLSYMPVDSLAAIKNAIHSFLFKWNEALQNGTYHQYLMFYDPEYVPDISWWMDWNKVKKNGGKPAAELSIELEKVSIFRHKAVFVVQFDQFVRSLQGDLWVGTRKLFIRDNGNGLRIIGDDYQVLPKKQNEKQKKIPKEKQKDHPLVAAYRNQSKAPDKESKIEDMIEGWLTAWSSKDIEGYGDYYAKGFRSGGMNRRSWIRYKNRLNQKYDYINVSMDNLAIQNGKKRSIATFLQSYASPGYKAVGLKRLVLIRENGQWKILRETWRKR